MSPLDPSLVRRLADPACPICEGTGWTDPVGEGEGAERVVCRCVLHAWGRRLAEGP